MRLTLSEKYTLEVTLVYLAGHICQMHDMGFGSIPSDGSIIQDPAWQILAKAGAQEDKLASMETFKEMLPVCDKCKNTYGAGSRIVCNENMCLGMHILHVRS